MASLKVMLAVVPLCVLVLLSPLTSGAQDSTAEANEAEKATKADENAGLCYTCVSADDPKCVDFDEDYFERFKRDCNHHEQKPHGDQWQNKDAVGCRKIIQEVEGKDRIVRQCAYSGEDVSGLKRAGNKGVRVFYYQCQEGLCNGATSGMTNAFLALSLPLALAFLLRRL